MNAFGFNTRRHLIALFSLICIVGASSDVFAQRDYDVRRPRERPPTEPVTIQTRASQPSRGVLAVVLTPVINGQVVVKDSVGRVVFKQDAGEEGQAEFQLPRGQIYEVEATSPGYLSASRKSRPLKNNEILRLKLTPQFATLRFERLPANAVVFVDGQLRATVDDSGTVTISEIVPGDHSILIRHPEYNDYTDSLEKLKAGDVGTYARVPLRRVAKLTIQGPPGASVFIDGAREGTINEGTINSDGTVQDGTVQIDYELERASEHVITVEKTGYQPWSKKLLLAPGPLPITVKLDPIETSTGFTDFFDDLSQWNAPSAWKIVSDPHKNNKKLEVKGEELGKLSDKTYRDFVAVFKIWLTDGKGATWAVRVDKEGRNYYLFHLAGPNSTNHTPKRFYTYLVKDGSGPVQVSTPIPVLVPLSQKDSYTITVIVKGHEIKQEITSDLTADSSDLGIWTDTTTTKERFLYGSFGFRAYSGEIFTVDELILSLDLEQFLDKQIKKK